jgi:hypothetical protein
LLSTTKIFSTQLRSASQDAAAGSNDASIEILKNYIVFDEPPLVLADDEAQPSESFELMLYTLLKVLLFIVKLRRSLDLIPTGPYVCCRGVECCKSAVPQA